MKLELKNTYCSIRLLVSCYSLSVLFSVSPLYISVNILEYEIALANFFLITNATSLFHSSSFTVSSLLMLIIIDGIINTNNSTNLSYLYCIWVLFSSIVFFTATPLHRRFKYCTFYSTTLFWQLEVLVIFQDTIFIPHLFSENHVSCKFWMFRINWGMNLNGLHSFFVLWSLKSLLSTSPHSPILTHISYTGGRDYHTRRHMLTGSNNYSYTLTCNSYLEQFGVPFLA